MTKPSRTQNEPKHTCNNTKTPNSHKKTTNETKTTQQKCYNGGCHGTPSSHTLRYQQGCHVHSFDTHRAITKGAIGTLRFPKRGFQTAPGNIQSTAATAAGGTRFLNWCVPPAPSLDAHCVSTWGDRHPPCLHTVLERGCHGTLRFQKYTLFVYSHSTLARASGCTATRQIRSSASKQFIEIT